MCMTERRTRDADIAVLEMGRWDVSLSSDEMDADLVVAPRFEGRERKEGVGAEDEDDNLVRRRRAATDAEERVWRGGGWCAVACGFFACV